VRLTPKFLLSFTNFIDGLLLYTYHRYNHPQKYPTTFYHFLLETILMGSSTSTRFHHLPSRCPEWPNRGWPTAEPQYRYHPSLFSEYQQGRLKGQLAL
jgi:hypothetical protein